MIKQERRFKSVVWRILLWPFLVILLIAAVMVSAGVLSYQKMQQQMVDRNLSSLQISMNQIETVMSLCEKEFANYIAYESSYNVLKSASPDQTNQSLFLYMAQTGDWLSGMATRSDEVRGAFICYKNLDQTLFRGNSDNQIHEFILKLLEKDDAKDWNSWQIHNVGGKNYLMLLSKYNLTYMGCWINMDTLMKKLDISKEHYLGSIYIDDQHGHVVSLDLTQNELIKIIKTDKNARLVSKNTRYWIDMSRHHLKAALLVPPDSVIKSIPVYSKSLYLCGIAAILLVPFLLVWIQKKIREPMIELSEAMKEFGRGNLEYRVPVQGKKTYDEFELLKEQMNETMEELNELQFTLYHTKLREQETKLRYISQQIRPHFILNALNLIYTYREDEFPMVRKMVLYLTNYFRYVVNLKQDFVELGQEMRHIENYLNIQKERYLEGFDFFVEWEHQVENCLIPPLIIQTFVENSIKYARNEKKLFVYVLAGIKDDKLKLMMADTGQGFSEQKLSQLQEFIENRNFRDHLGVGIENAVERLDILYDKQVKMIARNAISGGAVIELFIPIRYTTAKEDEETRGD